MTTDDERLEAAVGAVLDAITDRWDLSGTRRESPISVIRESLRPHLPPGRDALVEALRGLADDWGQQAASGDMGQGDIAELLADATDQVRAILARHAPEATDA